MAGSGILDGAATPDGVEDAAHADGSHDGTEILVVDDNEANLTAIEAALPGLGRPVVRAQSGREALRLLLERDFALILLDVQMPEMDGFETARLIRQRERSRRTPIIFVTAYSSDDADVLRGYRLGAVDFLFKPIEPEILKAKASVFVELQERTAEVRAQGERLREFERREAGRRLAAERERWEAQALREESQRKDEFLAVLAHELRNPLAPLATGLEVLRHGGLDAEEFESLRDSMERQLRHLVRLVDDLMDLARITHGKIELVRAVVDLRTVVRQASEDVAVLVADQRHHLLLEVGDTPVWVDGDGVRLVQVVSNLLHNAVRYTDPGGHLRVTCGIDGHEALITVEDDGRGIPAELLDRVFDMLVQQDRGRRGLGLGLTLVRQLVQLHGGQVHAHSDGPGQGSRFLVRLPRTEAPPPEAAAEDPDPPTPVRRRVAIVEDEEDGAASLASLLRLWGQDVRCAADGREGVDLILAWRPDVALVDLDMPRLDGFGLAEEVRSALGADAPMLIALTGYGRKTDRRRTEAAGFEDHLVKPVPADALRRALARGV
jgi:signal transduction histidine kinase